MEEILHQYVVYPIIYKVLYNYIPSGYIARFRSPSSYVSVSLLFPHFQRDFPNKKSKSLLWQGTAEATFQLLNVHITQSAT